MQLPTQSSFFFRESGISKCEVVRNVQQNHGTVAFAGDGRPDLEPALMVQAKITFRNWGGWQRDSCLAASHFGNFQRGRIPRQLIRCRYGCCARDGSLGACWISVVQMAVSFFMEMCVENFARRSVAILATSSQFSRAQGTASFTFGHAGGCCCSNAV